MSALQLREAQLKGVEMLRQGFAAGHRCQMLYLPTGGGKCLGIDTPVIMADGRVKMVQDVAVGDQLLGPDGGVRNVLSLARGRENLYRVAPVRQSPASKSSAYVVNESHILSLKRTGTDAIILADGVRIDGSDDVVNVNIKTLIKSSNHARHCLKGWRSGALEFHRAPEILPIPPYILGVWLGDGRANGPVICKPDGPIIDAWKAYGLSIGLGCSAYDYDDDRCASWAITNGCKNTENPFTAMLRALNLIENKHIPKAYLTASVADRLELIAGLLDTDGCHKIGGYDFVIKQESIARDLVFLCQSVGLYAYVSPCTKGIKSTGFIGNYWRVGISGDCERIPCKQKPATPRKQIKRHLVYGFDIEPLGIGEYFGFEIDGDKLFLLGDFTVTHNTEIAIFMMALAADKGNRSAMILDRRNLVNQTSQRLDRYKIHHGVMMADSGRMRPYEKIQVCSAQTLEKRGAASNLQVLFVDEAHQIRTETKRFIANNPELRVIGLSASPLTKGLGKVFTNVVSPISTNKLVDDGLLIMPTIYCAREIDMTGAKKVAGEWSSDDVGVRATKISGDIIATWIEKTTHHFGGAVKTIVHCASVAHGAELAQKFADAGFNFVAISYKDDEDFKLAAYQEFNKPNSTIMGLIAVDMLTKGFDSPNVLCSVMARPFSKSVSSVIQQAGRVMRTADGKTHAILIDHAGNFLRHGEQIMAIFEDGIHELDDGAEKPAKEKSIKEKEACTCPKCSALLRGDSCPCGWVRPVKSKVQQVTGVIEEFAKTKIEKAEKQDFYSQLLGMEKARGYKTGWAANNYREKFQVWPRGLNEVATECGPKVANFIRSKQIAWANRRTA